MLMFIKVVKCLELINVLIHGNQYFHPCEMRNIMKKKRVHKSQRKMRCKMKREV